MVLFCSVLAATAAAAVVAIAFVVVGVGCCVISLVVDLYVLCSCQCRKYITLFFVSVPELLLLRSFLILVERIRTRSAVHYVRPYARVTGCALTPLPVSHYFSVKKDQQCLIYDMKPKSYFARSIPVLLLWSSGQHDCKVICTTIRRRVKMVRTYQNIF